MDEDAHGSLTSLHDLSNLGDAELCDDPEEHRICLIGWQRADQREGTFEGFGILGTLTDVGRVRGPFGGDLALGSLPTTLARADVVDPPSGGDREQPSSEVGLVTVEAVETGGDLEPHGRGEIFGFCHPLAAEVAKEQMLVRPPDLAERVPVPGPRASNHLPHLS